MTTDSNSSCLTWGGECWQRGDIPIFGHSRWLFALNTYFALWCFVAVFEYLVNLLPFIKLGSSLSLHLSCPPPPLPLSSRFHIYAAGEWSLSDIRLSSKSRRIRKSPILPGRGSSHAESDELSQTVGQTLSVVVGAQSHLWDIATLSSLTAANMHLSEAISRMLESCFIWGKKAEILVQGILREHVNLLLKGPLHNLLLLGPLIDPPHATLCLLILAQFWIWPGCPGGVN